MEKTDCSDMRHIGDTDTAPNSRHFAFFRKLGNPRKVVAPMVDQSDLAFRTLTRRYGADLCFTQMFNANSMVNALDYMEENFQTTPEDRPLIAQIAGYAHTLYLHVYVFIYVDKCFHLLCRHDPDVMLRAALMLQDHCDAIDINLGCPQGIAKRGRYGAFLMEELGLLDAIVRRLSQGLRVPVTCKTRIYKGPDGFDRSVRLCETLINAGASMLTIHGRTREEKGHQVGPADWETIRRLRERFIGVPIIANGGIETSEDITSCLETTGCAAVMSSEGVLEDPQIFAARASNSSSSEQGMRKSQFDITEEYLALCRQYPPRGFKAVRSHVMKFLFRYFEIHEDLRQAAGDAHSLEDLEDLVRQLREHAFQRGDEAYPVSWYNRHNSQAKKHDMSTKAEKPNLFSSDMFSDHDESCCGGANTDLVESLFSGMGLFGDAEEEEVCT
jgi:tRNA-dihydrouridine synthase 1